MEDSRRSIKKRLFIVAIKWVLIILSIYLLITFVQHVSCSVAVAIIGLYAAYKFVKFSLKLLLGLLLLLFKLAFIAALLGILLI